MDIKFQNSLSDKLESFTPCHANKVSIYVCGPTVYDDIHIGNARPVVVFDVLKNFFSYLNYEVTYVSNYTDVDDKIINRAKAENISEKELAETYIKHFEDVRRELNASLPNYTPRVSNYIPQIIKYISDLVDSGYAYVNDGDVYFRVTKIKDYGTLSKIVIDDLISGARIETSDKKESPLDFVLWKKTEEGIKWNSPWGEGRPGWHTECCVMINSLFENGKIDIHGGGFDLKFPHHENEIAQSEAHNHNKIANIWMHNGFVNLNGEKMSKSLGNVIKAKDFIANYGGGVTRLLLLSTPYRAPINISDEMIQNAIIEYNKISSCSTNLAVQLQLNDVSLDGKATNDNMKKFLTSLADDLNVSNALTEMYALIKNINLELRKSSRDYALLKSQFLALRDMMLILGFSVEHHLVTKEDKSLYNDYYEARKNKDYELSDKIRLELMKRKIM